MFQHRVPRIPHLLKIVVVVALVGPLSFATSAGGYIVGDLVCSRTDVNLELAAGDDAWGGNYLNFATQAIQNLDGRLRISSTGPFVQIDVGGPDPVPMTIEVLGPNEPLAFMDCDSDDDGEVDDPRIVFNASRMLAVNDPFFQSHFNHIVLHEIGHIIGLRHSGFNDSSDGNHSYMTTCVSEEDALAIVQTNNYGTNPGKDIQQATAYIWDPLPYNQITMNLGFEQDQLYWTANNASLSISQTNGTDNFNATVPSSNYMRVKGLAHVYNSYAYQAATIWIDAADRDRYRYKMAYKEHTAPANTQISVRIYMKGLADRTPTCDLEYGLRNINFDNYDDDSVTPYILTNTSNTFTATNMAWNTLQGSFLPVTPTALLTSQGYRVQQRLHAKAILPNGNRVGVHFDMARVEDDK